MAFSVNTNITSLQAQEYLRLSSDFQSKTINRVTSGLRIVQSGDDAAGLAIANTFRSDQAVLSQGIRNANDGLSTLQTIDGGMSNISKLLDRARTLATQSASGTFMGERSVLNKEFKSVVEEIDRQAQAIGLNVGGAFAKNLSVFVGGGRASGDTTAINNGSVGVDLSTSTVDSRSLGLKGMQATGVSGTDIGANSAKTSVSEILGNTNNQASLTQAGYTDFYFMGSGFSNQGASGLIKVTVNLTGVNTAEQAATAINQAIQNAGNGSSAQATAFQNAGITASIVTDANGKQQLAFSSSSSAFQVRAGDKVAAALMGNFVDATTDGEGNFAGSYATAGAVPSGHAATTLTIHSGALTGGSIDLDAVDPAAADVDEFVSLINAEIAGKSELKALGFTAVNNGGKVEIRSGAGVAFNVTADVADSGFTAAAAGTAAKIGENSFVESAGASTIATPFTIGTALDPGEKQVITVSATDAQGQLHSLAVTLTNSTNDVDGAIKAINDALQQSNNATLQKIFAVSDGDASDKAGMRFLSSLPSFSISLGTGGLDQGFVSGTDPQGKVYTAAQQGNGGTADISTVEGAKTAVGTLEEAVRALGSAQAVVGKGQNQFSYAVNLAQSQLSNLAAAESRIRDADLANEAANLSKAQILLQAGVAALAQANSAPQQILSLLRG